MKKAASLKKEAEENMKKTIGNKDNHKRNEETHKINRT